MNHPPLTPREREAANGLRYGAAEVSQPHSNLEQPLPKVVYVMGMARSGSTILEILLGNNAGCVNVGELTHIFSDGFGPNAHCSCGRTTAECDVWSAVRSSLTRAGLDSKKLAVTVRCVDRHTSIIRNWLGWWKTAAWSDYHNSQLALFRGIQNATGAMAVAESSLYASRALALREIFGDRLKVVCITREPAGVLAAFAKPNRSEQLPKSTWKAFAYYMLVLTALRMACFRLGDSVLIVRFEDLQAEPERLLARIAAWTGLDLLESISRVRGESPLTAGHIVTGNRVRRERTIVFRRQDGSSRRLSLGGCLAVGMMRLWRRALRFS